MKVEAEFDGQEVATQPFDCLNDASGLAIEGRSRTFRVGGLAGDVEDGPVGWFLLQDGAKVVDFVGHTITAGDFSPNFAKVTALTNIPMPPSKK